MSDEWYYETDDVHGPVTGQELLQQANTGVIQPNTLVCKGSNGKWIQASRVKGLNTACQRTPTKPCPFCGEAILLVAKKCKHCGEFLDGATSSNATQAGESNKRILPLFLLYLFFGVVGTHAFYAGRMTRGLIYILLDLAALVGIAVEAPMFLILAVCLGVDFVRIVTGVYKDGDGRRISKWT